VKERTKKKHQEEGGKETNVGEIVQKKKNIQVIVGRVGKRKRSTKK